MKLPTIVSQSLAGTVHGPFLPGTHWPLAQPNDWWNAGPSSVLWKPPQVEHPVLLTLPSLRTAAAIAGANVEATSETGIEAASVAGAGFSDASSGAIEAVSGAGEAAGVSDATEAVSGAGAENSDAAGTGAGDSTGAANGSTGFRAEGGATALVTVAGSAAGASAGVLVAAGAVSGAGSVAAPRRAEAAAIRAGSPGENCAGTGLEAGGCSSLVSAGSTAAGAASAAGTGADTGAGKGSGANFRGGGILGRDDEDFFGRDATAGAASVATAPGEVEFNESASAQPTVVGSRAARKAQAQIRGRRFHIALLFT
jgi:hypothetical protein